MNIALVGNQNCGKTTLFNQLTGSKQHIGNFPGVTVEQKSGYLLGNKDVTVVDLPGIYSLTPYSIEEIVTRDYIFNRKPDCIINIIDATNLERNLYLTIQLLEMEIPFVIALNMMDEVRLNGTSIDVKKLSEELGVPVVPISASKNEGVSELAEVALGRAKVKNSAYHDLCDGAVHKAVHSLAHLLEENAEKCGFPPKYAAIKVIENDKSIIDKLKLDERQLDIIGHIVEDMEIACDTDREAAIVDMRYDYIEALCAKVVLKKGQNVNQEKSMKLDRILTHKIWAIPIFLCVMLAVFFLSFSLVGKWLSDLLTLGIDWLTGVVDGALTSAGISEWLHSLLIDGVFNGVGSVLSFVPTIMVLFFLLSILEDSGYMARVAFVMDKLLRKIGLSGKSFVPMLIGFGCSVPGILAARTVSSERDRKMTVLLVPFMSCSAKLPIYSLITMAFFPRYQALVMLGVYVLSMVVGVLYGLLLKVTVFKGNPVPFVMELPNYRWPSLKTLLRVYRHFRGDAGNMVFAERRYVIQLHERQFGEHSGGNRAVFVACVRPAGTGRLAAHNVNHYGAHRQRSGCQHAGGAVRRGQRESVGSVVRGVFAVAGLLLSGFRGAVHAVRGGGRGCQKRTRLGLESGIGNVFADRCGVFGHADYL